MPTLQAIGCMTGTSMDGLDAALTRLELDSNNVRRATLVSLHREPLGDLAESLGSIAAGTMTAPIDVLRTARRLGQTHATACRRLMDALPEASRRTPISFVAVHGQTVWHAPDDAAGHLSWQLMDPWPVVRRLGVAVCFDLRQADLIAGGQGAPITPIADPVLYAEPLSGIGRAAVFNLGGIANVTGLVRAPGGDEAWRITARDFSPCGILLDGLCRRLLDRPFDRDGESARAGIAPFDAIERIQQEIDDAARNVTTLGREQFSGAWLDRLTQQLRERWGSGERWREGLLAAAVEALAVRIVAQARTNGSESAILAGGNANHATLVDRLGQLAPDIRWSTSAQVGVPNEAREPMAMAVLAARSMIGQPGTLTAVTGADRPGPAGSWAFPHGWTRTPGQPSHAQAISDTDNDTGTDANSRTQPGTPRPS